MSLPKSPYHDSHDILCFAFVAALSIKSQINFTLFCCNLEGPPESSHYPYFQLHFFNLTCPSSPRSFPWFQAQFILLNYLTKVWIFLSTKYIEDFVCMWNFQESCWKNSNYFSRKPWQNIPYIHIFLLLFQTFHHTTSDFFSVRNLLQFEHEYFPFLILDLEPF